MDAVKPSTLLPAQDAGKPIELKELLDFRRKVQSPPNVKDGWSLELEQNGVQVHRLAEVDEEGATLECLRVEVELACEPLSGLMFVKDPERRKMWDDVVGSSLKVLNVQNHEFVNFHVDAFSGLASKSLLLWSRAQAYDENGIERQGGDAASTWVMMWRHANVNWSGLPAQDENFEKNTYWGVVVERTNSDGYFVSGGPSCRVKVYIRFKYVSSMLVRNAIPSLLNYYASDYCTRLQAAAASKTWEDSEAEAFGPYVQPVAPVPPAPPPRPEPVPVRQPEWSPDVGLARPAIQIQSQVEVKNSIVTYDDENVPAYQLRYARGRDSFRDPPPLEPLQNRLKGALSDWRKGLQHTAATKPIPPLTPLATDWRKQLEKEAEQVRSLRGGGLRAIDPEGWLGSVVGSMSEVRIVPPPWVTAKQSAVSAGIAGDVWQRLDRAGLGERPLSQPAGGAATAYEEHSAPAPRQEEQPKPKEAEEEDEGGWFGGLFGAAEAEPVEVPEEPPRSTLRDGRKKRTMKRHDRATQNKLPTTA